MTTGHGFGAVPDGRAGETAECGADASLVLNRPARVRRRSQFGQSLTELAILLPVLLLVTMGVLDLGRAFYTYEAIANAAREGARFCALHPGPGPGQSAQDRVDLELTGTSIDATASPSDCLNKGPILPAVPEGGMVTITVTTTFRPVTVFFLEEIPLSASASMVMW